MRPRQWSGVTAGPGPREGAELQLVRSDPGSGPEAGPAADAWILPGADLPRWAAAGKLLPVPDSYTSDKSGYAWEGLLPLYREKLLVWDRIAYALPLLGEAPLCFYRADLLADARHREAYAKAHGRKLGPPATWEEFEAVAAYFQGQADVFPGGASLPPLPEQNDSLDHLFYSVAAPFARRAVPTEESGDRAGGIVLVPLRQGDHAAAHRHAGLRACVGTAGPLAGLPPTGLRPRAGGSVPARPRRAVRGGGTLDRPVPARGGVRRSRQVRLLPAAGERRLFRLQDGSISRGGRRQRCLVPGGGRLRWRSCRADSSQPEAAFALLAELSDPQTSRKIVIDPEWGGGGFRAEHLANSAGWSGFGLDTGQTVQLVETLRQSLTHPGVKNPVLRLRTPDQHSHQRILDEELRANLSGKRDARAALTVAARRWREMDEPRDLKTRRAEYLLSLSLQPPR